MAIDVQELPAPSTAEAPTPATLQPLDQVEQVEGQTSESAAAPKPTLKDLIAADPDLKREFDGTLGEHQRRVAQSTKEQLERERAEAEAKSFTDWQQQQLQAEALLRQRERAHLAQLQASGDPFALSEAFQRIQARQDAWDAQQQQTSAAQRYQQALADAASQARKSEAEAWDRALKADFRTLPREVQAQLSGRTFEGASDEEARAKYFRAVRDATRAHNDEARIEAEVKKRLAKANLAAPALDLGVGMPVGGQTFNYMEDAEAAFVAEKISPDQMRRIRASGLPRRNP